MTDTSLWYLTWSCLLPQSMTKLAQSAKNVTRDLNPNADLKNLRTKTSRKELIVYHDKNFIVIIIQEWTPAKEDQSHLQQPATWNKTKPRRWSWEIRLQEACILYGRKKCHLVGKWICYVSRAEFSFYLFLCGWNSWDSISLNILI